MRRNEFRLKVRLFSLKFAQSSMVAVQNSSNVFELARIQLICFYHILGTEQISSIAVDWITGNVYFTSQYSLSVCTRNGKICNKLKTSVFEIKYVALVPKFGYVLGTHYLVRFHIGMVIFSPTFL